MDIQIDDMLRAKSPGFQVTCIRANVVFRDTCPELWAEMEAACGVVSGNLVVEQISALPVVDAARKAYRACGKDPARYRLSSEALLRRVVQGKGLYQVNNIVDINNLVSLKHHYSIGAFDADAVKFPVTFRIGQAGEPYEGIGRGSLNIENLPVLSDAQGPFGSPTSDSERTKTNPDMKRLLFCILAFGGAGDIDSAVQEAVALLKRHADATEIEITTIQ